MDERRALWNAQQDRLRKILPKKDSFEEAVKLCLEQHAMVHSSEMPQANQVTFEDELWEGLDETVFRTATGVKDRTIAYGMWHSSRIEDITMNILVAGGTQVIDSDNWIKRINSRIKDTGNAMGAKEILEFSSDIDMRELRNYRAAVGRRTRELIQGLGYADLKRKMDPRGLQRILDEGAVLDVEGARWLIDFWGRKDVAGILLMPVTRHHIVHINESMTAKKRGKREAGKRVSNS